MICPHIASVATTYNQVDLTPIYNKHDRPSCHYFVKFLSFCDSSTYKNEKGLGLYNYTRRCDSFQSFLSLIKNSLAYKLQTFYPSRN